MHTMKEIRKGEVTQESPLAKDDKQDFFIHFNIFLFTVHSFSRLKMSTFFDEREEGEDNELSNVEAKRKWDSYFDEVPPKQWRYLDFYKTRSLRPGFSRSFAKESLVLKKSLDNLLEHDSDMAKVSAVKLFTKFKVEY